MFVKKWQEIDILENKFISQQILEGKLIHNTKTRDYSNSKQSTKTNIFINYEIFIYRKCGYTFVQF